MTNDDIAEAFEGGRVEPAGFHHRDHVLVAWLLLARYPRPEAERRLLHGLRALAARAGRAERFSAALTTAWIDRIAAACAAHPDAGSFDALTAACPDLLDPRSVAAAAPTL